MLVIVCLNFNIVNTNSAFETCVDAKILGLDLGAGVKPSGAQIQSTSDVCKTEAQASSN